MKTLNRQFLRFELDDWTLKDTIQLRLDFGKIGLMNSVKLPGRYKHTVDYKEDKQKRIRKRLKHLDNQYPRIKKSHR